MSTYLDHAASTPVRDVARIAYVDALTNCGNPSSVHRHGQAARAIVEDARERVARHFDADPMEVVFTSGGTESVNLGIAGLFRGRRRAGGGRRRIIVPEAEHHATLDTVTALTNEGADIEWISVDAEGLIDLVAWQRAFRDDPESIACATALAANNEVGTLQPWRELCLVAREAGVPFHLDAIAALGHIPLALRPASAVSLSGHKIGAVPGVGVLLVDRGLSPEAIIHGGGQQRGLRSGTMDAPAAASFAAALDELERERDAEVARVRLLSERLWAQILQAVPQAIPRGSLSSRLEHNLNFTFPGCQSDSLLFLLDEQGISVSTGSACQAGVAQPSHVLMAMGLSEDDSSSALRISLGHTTSQTDVDALVAALPRAYELARVAGRTA